MVLIGLTGNIGSGKTTFGTYLGEAAGSYIQLEASEPIAEVANALRRKTGIYPAPGDLPAINEWLETLPEILKGISGNAINRDVLSLTEERITANPDLYNKLFDYLALLNDHPDLKTGDITAVNKTEHRPLLQWIGGYVAKKVDGKFWFKELVKRARESDQYDLATIGGVRFPADAAAITEADGVIIELLRPGQTAVDSHDITEKERQKVQADICVINDGTLEDLKKCAVAVWQDLHSGNHVEYRASKCK